MEVLMLAQVSLTPVGSGEETKELLARAAKFVASTELPYQLTSMGLIIEGDWDEVMTCIKKCHQELAGMVDRVVTNIVIDDRKGMAGRLRHDVLNVEYAAGDALATGELT